MVSAVFNCADPRFGFKQYACTTCGKDWTVVAFSCKSRFCLRCGRVNGEQFALSIKERLHH
ncbi:MAG: transposase zinc-binding domain-containing protein [Oligoflexales bacterium]